MDNPKPINLMSDEHFRNQGWPALARDADGHVITMCARGKHESEFKDWLAECFDDNLTIINLKAPLVHAPKQEGE